MKPKGKRDKHEALARPLWCSGLYTWARRGGEAGSSWFRVTRDKYEFLRHQGYIVRKNGRITTRRVKA